MEVVEATLAPPPSVGRRGPAFIFVGFMGAGKSVAARMLAAELGVRALDSDRELERELCEPIDRFFDREGEEAFRRREEEIVLRLLAREDVRVLALGGGALGSEEVRHAVRDHIVVHLEVESDQAWHRASGRDRPLARDRSRFEQLHEDRRPVYESAAQAILPPADRNLTRRAAPALLSLLDAPPGTHLEWGQAASGEYPVFFGPGLVRSGFFHPLGRRRFLMADPSVLDSHPLTADGVATVPGGEQEKTVGRMEVLVREMARAGVAQGDVVVALGGGVVGDLAGFCAAVYQRGIDWVGVPTTLVAQVDSAYGGKTGVDLPEGKNYVGAFHQPAAVLVDPDTLGTLPPREHAAGYAEVVKTALIAGGTLWARVRAGPEPDHAVILGCLRTKLRVVAGDERDGGRRQVLNLGHTIGHAVEAATGYRRYRHGEAVGIGLMCALRLSGREALRTEVAELLRARKLPLGFDGASPDDVLAFLERDKKRRGGWVPFVLVDAPGQVTPGHELAPAVLRAAVEEAFLG